MKPYTPTARSSRPPSPAILVAVLLALVLGTAHQLDAQDGLDELDAAQAVAEDAAEAQQQARAAADADFEARSRQRCAAERGPDAIFFMLPSGDFVCRFAPPLTTASNH